ncbi:hypothetical protein B296_00055941, partial [Ensete ventricosum]
MQSASVRRESRRRAMGGASTGSIPLLPFSVAGIVGLALFYFYYVLWIRPERMRSKLRSQGIDGPPPSLIHGNILEMRKILREERKKKAQEEECGPSVTASYVSALFPYLTRWRKRYAKSCLLEHPGPIFMYSTGSMQTLHVSHPDLVKEISVCKSLDLGKPLYLQKDRGALLGKGILTSNGALWAHQRKVIATELFMDKVKVYLYPYLPMKSNRKIWRLTQEIRTLILNIVKERKEDISTSSGQDLLQSIIEGSTIPNSGLDSAESFIVDNCKNIYFAGHETTAVTATWCLMLLASHPEWQHHVREEVLEVCQGKFPNYDMLRRLKMMEEDEEAESFGLSETIRGEGEDNDDKMEKAAAIHDRGSHVGEPTVRHVVSESDTRYTITYFDRRRPIDGEIDCWRSIEEEKGKKKKRKRRKQKKYLTPSSPTCPRRPLVAREPLPPSPPAGDFCPRAERRFVSPRWERDRGD